MTVKTLFLYDRCGEEPPVFFEKEGDFRHLEGVYINSMEDEAIIDELHGIIYGESGTLLIKELNAPTKDWSFFVRVGFIQ